MRFPPSGCKEPCRKCHGAALTPGRSKVACCDGVPKCASVCVRWQRGRERDGRRAGLSLACSHQILGGWTGETVWHRRGDFASLAAAVPLPLSACLPACACMCVRLAALPILRFSHLNFALAARPYTLFPSLTQPIRLFSYSHIL
jgi:hypothetical protein